MILCDTSIEKLCKVYDLISPYHREQLQPASYDLMLGDIKDTKDIYVINPQEFILASTAEWVSIPNHLVGRLEGKSSWARLGLIVHTAGFVDPGFKGQLVLEITNLSNQPILLKRGERIAQICFYELDEICERPYGHPELNSHYQNQVSVAKSYMES